MRDDAAGQAASFDQRRREADALAAENERLRDEAGRNQAALRHLEAQYAGIARELAGIHASRAWRIGQRLRGLFRHPIPRRAARPPRRGLVAWVPEAGAEPPTVALIVPPHPGTDTPSPPRASLAGARCEVLRPAPADADNAVALCNAAAATVSAEHIVLWDGVSRPDPGWLAALADCFGRIEGAGMAGALLLAPDGRIAAAGATIPPDGRPTPLGAG